MKHGSLFSGIGGFDLAAEWMGWENVFHCEINKFCNKILKQHFPNAESYTDITTTDFSIWRGKVDILTGGFPCQPYSLAGKRKGKADDRHLWPEMLRTIKQIQPRWVVGENVFGLINWSGGLVFHEVQTDLEAAGYEVWPYVLPACAKNAPHRRDRVWFLAYSNAAWERRNKWEKENETNVASGSATNRKKFGRKLAGDSRPRGAGFKNSNIITTNPNLSGLQREQNNGISDKIGAKRNEQFSFSVPSTWEKFPTQPPVCGRNDGISNRVDRIKALGNAVVPQIVFQLFQAIEQYESLSQ